VSLPSSCLRAPPARRKTPALLLACILPISRRWSIEIDRPHRGRARHADEAHSFDSSRCPASVHLVPRTGRRAGGVAVEPSPVAAALSGRSHRRDPALSRGRLRRERRPQRGDRRSRSAGCPARRLRADRGALALASAPADAARSPPRRAAQPVVVEYGSPLLAHLRRGPGSAGATLALARGALPAVGSADGCDDDRSRTNGGRTGLATDRGRAAKQRIVFLGR